MAYDKADAARMRAALQSTRGISEKPMFGGLVFLLRDHMLCGLGEPGYMFRVGKEQEAAALKRPGASPIVFNGRRYGGMVWVDGDSCRGRTLASWIGMAKEFVGALPPKKPKKKAKAKAAAKKKSRQK
jgi:hypothetical protein